MRRASKTLVAALAVFLLALGLVACGGGDDSSSTAADTAGTAQIESTPNEDASKQADAKSGGDQGQSKDLPSGGDASDFVPKQHEDSGGGSEQFKTNGGDNSVQEFGEESDASELEEAATALHNFLDARAVGNWSAACEYMAASVVESFKLLAEKSKGVNETSCGGILAAVTNSAARPTMKAEAEKADVGSLRIEGEQAFLIYTGLEGTTMVMPMLNEDGAWKVGALSGTPLS